MRGSQDLCSLRFLLFNDCQPRALLRIGGLLLARVSSFFGVHDAIVDSQAGDPAVHLVGADGFPLYCPTCSGPLHVARMMRPTSIASSHVLLFIRFLAIIYLVSIVTIHEILSARPDSFNRDPTGSA